MGLIDLSIMQNFNRKRYGYTAVGWKSHKPREPLKGNKNVFDMHRQREWQP